MNLPEEIENKLDELFGLCNKYKVNRLFIFGFLSKRNFNSKTSDIDLVIELGDLPPVEHGETLMKFWSELKSLFSKKIDLLTLRSRKNPFLKKEIEDTKLLIYNRAG
jgi:predicted nucleotidyltransferase